MQILTYDTQCVVVRLGPKPELIRRTIICPCCGSTAEIVSRGKPWKADLYLDIHDAQPGGPICKIAYAQIQIDYELAQKKLV